MAGSKNPIDAFVRARLAEKNLAPSPAVDRRTLIRRLTFDLHGLPPTPEEVEAQNAEELPDREAMSLINPGVDGISTISPIEPPVEPPVEI